MGMRALLPRYSHSLIQPQIFSMNLLYNQPYARSWVAGTAVISTKKPLVLGDLKSQKIAINGESTLPQLFCPGMYKSDEKKKQALRLLHGPDACAQSLGKNLEKLLHLWTAQKVLPYHVDGYKSQKSTRQPKRVSKQDQILHLFSQTQGLTGEEAGDSVILIRVQGE